MTADPEHPVVQGELAELRRSLDVAYARVEGGLALLSHRAEQTAKEVDDLSTPDRRTGTHPLAAARGRRLTAVGALVVAVWQALGR